ncbi:MAG: spore protease YyaC [Desulfitobacteriaceae bacterium]|nr:spore protease YyaC [Desulfitobacteriaceae bacterium]MDD4345351.1 spore protease YyaC [Desulfitobacteriaceae bacterium]MDD4400326.1 spore protease YyaC [Desulfitobacteriaceae bacterium]
MNLLSVFTKPSNIKAHIEDYEGTNKIRSRLTKLFTVSSERPALILCIGTDRSTGDSLGPLVGTQLINYELPKLNVIGTLKDPVHATNLAENILFIEKTFVNPMIIAIDACLGRLDSVGYITLANGPLKPGTGVHKVLPAVGEAHLTGTVNISGFMEYIVLQNTRLGLVWQMAETISRMIAVSYFQSRMLEQST